MKKKNRDISLSQYLQVLFEEYVTAELRARIYARLKDKEFYKKLMQYKKEKALDIAQRNNLETIFSSADLYRAVSLKVLGAYGFPNFTYIDAEDQCKREKKDFYNYYKKGSEVRIFQEGQKYDIFGIVLDCNFEESTIQIETKSGTSIFKKNHITRVF